MSHITKIKGAKLRSKDLLVQALLELGYFIEASLTDENSLTAVTPWQKTPVNILAAYQIEKRNKAAKAELRNFGFVAKHDDKGVYYELQADCYATNKTAKQLMVEVTQRYVGQAAAMVYAQQQFDQVGADMVGAGYQIDMQRADVKALARVEIIVDADGEVIEHVTGVTGAECQSITSAFDQLLDGQIDFQAKPEYFQVDQFGADLEQTTW